MTPSRRRRLLIAAALLITAGCSGGGDAATVVEAPSSVSEIVEATLAGAGLEVGYRLVPEVGEPYELLRADTTFDTATTHAYQTALGRLSGEFEAGVPPPETDLGENWVIDRVGYTREPGSRTARVTSGTLSGILGADVASGSGDAAVILAEMLAGWPGVTVSNDEVVDGVPTHWARFERGDGDVLDVWVDGEGRLVKVERRTDRSPMMVVEQTFRVLDVSPEIPPLPTVDE